MKKRVMTVVMAAALTVAAVMPAFAAGSVTSSSGSGSGSSGSGSYNGAHAYVGAVAGSSSGIWTAEGWAETPGSWAKNENGSWALKDGAHTWANTWIVKGGVWYYIGADGIMVTGTHVINGVAYNFNASGACLR